MISAEGDHPLRPAPRWAWMGAAACAALVALDLGPGSLNGDRVASNVAGTLALAPTLTGIGGSRRHVVAVGVLATALAVLLCLVDGVPLVTGLVRCGVVAVATAVVAVVAGARQRQLAQLQDRRQAARTLQAAMLTELPQPDHLQLASRYLPASSGDQVGGDWYDALVDAGGSTVLVIGDVVGHDIRAAATMGQVRAVLRTCAVQGDQLPSQVLTSTERSLEHLGLDVLASATVVRIDQSPAEAERGLRRITWSSAGHPPPILVVPGPGAPGSAGRAPAVQARVLRHGGDCDVAAAAGPPGHGSADVLLGVGSQTGRVDHSCQVPPGATLLLYTDGLVERRDADLDAGTEALCRVLEAEASRELEDLLDVGLRQLVGAGHGDDVAVLAVRAHREDGPRPPEAGPPHGAGPVDADELPPVPDVPTLSAR
ncbi:PP2C family protein-serine/threonine phosphatase [Quadrisphaera sp. INWT6]|uniref:PP2C family protein-serine/threonine phosphatase n=1 Tax=Quadrisphaera sp. INWT6 TaxID=2596917 RepID=UPI001892170E|nr:PP2C family protein-serine/threonine phosphatase [Quadrisphaera sp. INWT6]MBF5080748.1 serine/threonine-protein phosphatase [Quadrisphaera sp. INWT6]